MNPSNPTVRRAFPRPTAWSLAAAILASLQATSIQARATDTLSTVESPPAKDSLCRVPRQLFVNSPISLKESRSVFAIGMGWAGTKWGTRLDVGVVQDHQDPRDPLAWDFTAGLYWRHNPASSLTIYEGITLTDQTGLYRSFEGHAVSMSFLAGCEFRPDPGKDAFFLEAGTGGAFTERRGSYRGGTVLSAGLRHYAGF